MVKHRPLRCLDMGAPGVACASKRTPVPGRYATSLLCAAALFVALYQTLLRRNRTMRALERFLVAPPEVPPWPSVVLDGGALVHVQHLQAATRTLYLLCPGARHSVAAMAETPMVQAMLGEHGAAVAILAKRGFHVHAAKPDTYASTATAGVDARAYARWASRTFGAPGRIIVIGHSLGCGDAVVVASALAVRCSGALLVAPILRLDSLGACARSLRTLRNGILLATFLTTLPHVVRPVTDEAFLGARGLPCPHRLLLARQDVYGGGGAAGRRRMASASGVRGDRVHWIDGGHATCLSQVSPVHWTF